MILIKIVILTMSERVLICSFLLCEPEAADKMFSFMKQIPKQVIIIQKGIAMTLPHIFLWEAGWFMQSARVRGMVGFPRGEVPQRSGGVSLMPLLFIGRQWLLLSPGSTWASNVLDKLQLQGE